MSELSVICSVRDGETTELYRLPSDKLKEIQPSRVTTIYEYDKNAIKGLVQKMEL